MQRTSQVYLHNDRMFLLHKLVCFHDFDAAGSEAIELPVLCLSIFPFSFWYLPKMCSANAMVLISLKI